MRIAVVASLALVALCAGWTRLADRACDHDEAAVAAAREGDVQALRREVRRGVPIDCPKRRVSLLMHAAHAGDRQSVRALIDLGADVNAAGPGGFTPLMLATTNDKPDVVRILLDAGADPGRQTQSGLTALDFARNAGFARVERALADDPAPDVVVAR